MKRFVNPATLWPPLILKSSSSSSPSSTPPLSSSSSITHEPVPIISRTKRIHHIKKAPPVQQHQQQNPKSILPYFDDMNTAFAPRSEKNPMRNYMFDQNTTSSTNADVDDDVVDNNDEIGHMELKLQSSSSSSTSSTLSNKLQLSKAQRQYQKRVQQQRNKEEHRQLALEKDRQLRKRVSRPGCNATDNVPVREYTNGRVGRRTFNFVHEKWCSVCNEPVEVYVNHVGRKDHALLDQHFEGIVEYDRTWSAHEVLFGKSIEHLEDLLLTMMATSKSNNKNSNNNNNNKRAIRNKSGGNGENNSNLSLDHLRHREIRKRAKTFERMLFRSRFFHHHHHHHHRCSTTKKTTTTTFSLIPVYDKLDQLRHNFSQDECARRFELFAMLHNLLDAGAIDHANQRAAVNKHTIFGVFLGGHLALHYIMPSCTMNLFPAGSPDHLSNVEDFVSSSYNMETAFDMCNMKKLPGLPEHYSNQQAALSVSGKSNVVRVLLSQLKPAILMNDEYQQEVEFAKPEKFFKEDDFLFGEEFGGGGGGVGVASSTSSFTSIDGGNQEQQQQQQQQKKTRFSLRRANIDYDVSENTATRKEKDDDQNQNDDDDYEDHNQEDQDDDEFFQLQHRMNKTAAVETLMAICGRSLVAELVHCRISEYVVRAERPWTGVGQMEQLAPGSTATDGGSNPPLVRFDLSSRPEVDATPWKLREVKK